jgi:hypothetical protein
MTTPTLLPSLPPRGELISSRETLVRSVTTPTLLPSLPPKGKFISSRETLVR